MAQKEERSNFLQNGRHLNNSGRRDDVMQVPYCVSAGIRRLYTAVFATKFYM